MDYLAAIGDSSARLLTGLAGDRLAPVRSCGSWTVQDCAHHVGGLHHALSRVVAGRPTTDGRAFGELIAPRPDDAGLPDWVAEGSAALVGQLAAAGPDEPCWSWWPERQTVGFWSRRAAHETSVHRWDVEEASGVTPRPSDPVLASDGVDEYLDLMVPMTRRRRSAPASTTTVHLHAVDVDGEWLLSFPEVGASALQRAHLKGDVALRGGSEALLLFLWGRRSVDRSGIEVVGDRSVIERWPTLVPPI